MPRTLAGCGFRQRLRNGYIPANLEWDHYVEEYFAMQRFAQIGLYFFFSSELSYSPASPQVTASRVFHVHSSDRQKPLAKPVFIGENIGVCLSQDSPQHPRKRSTDWPVKRRFRVRLNGADHQWGKDPPKEVVG